MIVRVVTLFAVLLAAVIALVCFGLVRGRSHADDFMRHVDGGWKRTQTRFAAPRWQFYYEAQDREYRRSAPIMITADLFGKLPHRITINAMKEGDTVTLPSDAIPVSPDKAYS